MKYVKLLSLLAGAATALTVFAGTASATITVAGFAYNGTLIASSSNISFGGSISVKCSHSTIAGNVKNGNTATVSSVDFSNCGNDTVVVQVPGSLSISSSGTVTLSGNEIGVQIHRTIFGVPITTHCIYVPNNTDIGALTEGVSPPVMHMGSAPVPQRSTDAACGNDAVLTGEYTFSNPSSAITVD